MQNKITRFLLFFLGFLLLFQFFSEDRTPQASPDDVVLSSEESFVLGREITLTIANNSAETIVIQNRCPENPLRVEFYQNGEWITKTAQIPEAKCEGRSEVALAPNTATELSFGLWTHDLFSEAGQYRVVYETQIEGKEKSYTHSIEINPPSFIRRTWNTLLYQPIFNTLFFFIAKLPGHSLGWAVILLTLIIKLILLVPNHKALKSQKQMHRIQPQLDALRQKYKNDPQRLSQETMALWKKHKVNPMGSCLPMLIQFPILIALFYVVRDGLNVVSPDLFYEPLRYFDASMVNPVFLNIIDLTKRNFIVLPLIVGGLQFVQIRMSLGRVQNKSAANPALPMMNQMMLYVMPLMIAVFTASLPAAVGLYWGTSTLFSMIQQWVINKTNL